MQPAVPVDAASAPEAQTLSDAHTAAQRLWCTVVHDDPVNTMDYVTWVFHTYFGFPIPLARRRMLQVHTTGRAVVSRGARERMEVDVTAMHSYGLHATIEPLADDDADSGPSAGGPDGGGA
ncbi:MULTISPECIES: ATP-dependent Clp protease adapter ClpS [Actinomyces]|uniref:Adaptor protein clps core n=1 Tax=Actinomyces glycerinitolerans TaxID=1892869 RepID=A0A1M4S062_9ACTO|nr:MULTISPECIES: ATP-dependent Clp protease adapter ClpS [Actinomyces]RAX23908.1 ATP-dependent Clp protease adapter ClpS [Actinomyces sp. Z3]RAX24740.1 ATP-dependent Clp protease adapter ClpS [Actinomyces sp. Z5]SHE25588.1 adaptor protein clps core [Actinomyces glycerinitolerans]